MKQGSGHTSDSARKREPHAMAINPGGVAQMGTHVGNHVMDKSTPAAKAVEPMHAGRGFTAPRNVGTTSHHCGSQGKHR